MTLVMAVCWTAAITLVLGEEELPTSVKYQPTANGRFVLTIENIHTAAPRPEQPDIEPGFYSRPIDFASIPAQVSLSVDDEKRTCTIITSRKLDMAELPAAINKLAKLRGDIPCWAELLARDLKRAADFRHNRYIVDEVDGEFPSGIAWCWLPRFKVFSAPFAPVRDTSIGRLLIVPATTYKGYSTNRYSVRVLDSDGRVVWSDTSTAFGIVRVAVVDSDGDGAHEIYLERHVREGVARFHIKSASEQEAGPDG